MSNEPRDVTIGRRLSQPFSRSVRAHRSTPGSEQPGQGREGGAARRANVYAANAAVLVCLCPRIAVGSRLRSYDPLSSARDRESAPSKCASTLVGGFGPATRLFAAHVFALTWQLCNTLSGVVDVRCCTGIGLRGDNRKLQLATKGSSLDSLSLSFFLSWAKF